MRRSLRIEPPKDFDPRLYNILKQLGEHANETQAGLANVDRGLTTTGAGSIGITDHGALTGLIPVGADYNDDHTQYAFLFGRTGGQVWIGDPKTTNLGADVGLNLRAFAGDPTDIAGPAQLSLLDMNAFLTGDNIYFGTQGASSTECLVVAGGSGFVNTTNYGGMRLLGQSNSLNALAVEANLQGLTVVTAYIKARASQSGNLIEWRDSTNSPMSYIRVTDGAFVGPIVASGTDSHPDNIFQITGSVTPGKIAMFEVDGFAGAGTHIMTVPDADGTLALLGLAQTWTALQTFNDNNFQIIGNVGPTRIAQFDADQISNSTTRTYSFPDFAGTFLLTSGGSVGQVIGALAHTGGGTYSLAVEGPLLLCTSSAALGDTRPYYGLAVTLSGATAYTGFDASISTASLSDAASGSIVGANFTISGLSTLSSGTLAIKGLRFNPSFSIPAGATFTPVIGVHCDLTVGTTAGGTMTDWVGFRAELRGPLSNGPATTNVYGFESSPGWRGGMMPALVSGFICDKLSTVTYGPATLAISCTANGTTTLTSAALFGPVRIGMTVTGTGVPASTTVTTVTDTSTIVVSNAVTAGTEPTSRTFGASMACVAYEINSTFGASSAVTTWSGLRIPTIAGPATIWGLNITGTMNNQIAGKLSLGQAKAPASTLDILGDIATDTTTGTKIGTAAAQKLGFWNAAPIVQPTVAGAAAVFVANTSLIANDTATFDGYTLGQVVKALRNSGLLA